MGGVSLPPVPFFAPSSPFGVGGCKSPICLHTNLQNRAGKRKRIFIPENPRLHYRQGSLAVGSLSRSEASNWFRNCTGEGRNCTGEGRNCTGEGRNCTETGKDLDRDGERFVQRRGKICTETGKGFGQRRGKIWTETGKDLDRDGEGFGQRRGRIWTETRKDLDRDGLFKESPQISKGILAHWKT